MTALDRLKQAFPGWRLVLRPVSVGSRGFFYAYVSLRAGDGVVEVDGGWEDTEDAAVYARIAAWHEAVRPLVEKAVAAGWDCEARADISYDQAHKYENTRGLPAAIVRRVLGEDK